MAIVLQVLGAIFLVLILFLAVAVLTIRAKLRNLARNLEGMTASLASSVTPARIHLRPMAAPSWEDEAAVAAQTRPLPEFGFSKAGAFQVEEIPGLSLQAWVNPRSAVTAVVYEHPTAGVWTDMVTRYQDGTRATFANTQRGEGVDHAPGHTVERFPGLGSRELYERFLADRPDRPTVTPSAETFAEAFEKAYADEMDWRNSRGGATEEEIRRIASLSGETYDEEIIQATRRMAEARAMGQLDESIRERFLAETPLSASEWEGVRNFIVIVHDRMSQDAFTNAMRQCLVEDDDWDDDAIPQVDGSPERSPRRLFEAWNAGRAERKRCRKVGSVQEPVAADVYVAPGTED
jgi:hypothetical protein